MARTPWAGVVNFIMNNRFEGVQLSSIGFTITSNRIRKSCRCDPRARGDQPGAICHPRRQRRRRQNLRRQPVDGLELCQWQNNATVFFSYKRSTPLFAIRRDFRSCSTGSTANAFTCGGSSTSFPGRFLNLNSGCQFHGRQRKGGVRAFNATLDQYNFAPTNFFQRPSNVTDSTPPT